MKPRYLKRYSIEYFIAKFKKIPARLWCVGAFTKGKKHCALGHCGRTQDKVPNEAKALSRLLHGYTTAINDGEIYQQLHSPKERILAALENERLRSIH